MDGRTLPVKRECFVPVLIGLVLDETVNLQGNLSAKNHAFTVMYRDCMLSYRSIFDYTSTWFYIAVKSHAWVDALNIRSFG